ncbi:hypothetical protein EMCRGX_G021353 [Ephydatia muelleri]
MGHIVSKNGIEADPEKTTKVKHWSLPRNVKEVQQFLGFANYYRRFIKCFAKIAKPLHKLTERSAVAFRWTPNAKDFTKPFILDTDASNEGIGAVLSQLDSQGQELTIVPYNGFTEPRNWKDKLPDGWKNCSSLNLKSSICGLTKEQGEEEDVLPIAALQISGLNMEEIRKMQAQNEWKLLIEARKSNIQPLLKEQEGKSIEFLRLCQIWDQLVLHERVMYRKYFDSKNPSGIWYQLLVPAGLRKRVLEETHDGLCGGHLGEEKTFQKLKLSHYWPGYWSSVRDPSA